MLNASPLQLDLFFKGERLLFSTRLALAGAQSHHDESDQPELLAGNALLAVSLGLQPCVSRTQAAAVLPALSALDSLPIEEPVDVMAQALKALVLSEPELVDCYMNLHGLRGSHDHLPRLMQWLSIQFPRRPDLQVEAYANLPLESWKPQWASIRVHGRDLYRRHEPLLRQVMLLWRDAHLTEMQRCYFSYALLPRFQQHTDSLLRLYTSLGRVEQTQQLFFRYLQLEQSDTAALNGAATQSLSNILFGLLSVGVSALAAPGVVDEFRRRTLPSLPGASQSLRVHERPVVAVLSPDLRFHPVGRFWLPMARRLSERYRLVHVSTRSADDALNQQIKQLSAAWAEFRPEQLVEISDFLQGYEPAMLLDLAGHTADSCVALLNNRLAPVQASFLGFFGPSFAQHCDWWIVDRYVAALLQPYPGPAEPIWTLPFSGFCYDTSLHPVPPLEELKFTRLEQPRFASFNHSRKLSPAYRRLVASLLHDLPESSFVLRAHAFADPQVRRYVMQQFVDAGSPAHSLLFRPFAPTARQAMLDFQDVHCHLDAFPTCGTTTTLDALAMGTPVVSLANGTYAGSVTAGILASLDLDHCIASSPTDYPAVAMAAYQRYREPENRLALARHVRGSMPFDTAQQPSLFADEICKMIRWGRDRQA